MAGYMDGFMVGSIMGDTSAQTNQALRERNDALDDRDAALDERDAALNQVRKLSMSLEKEHKRFVEERKSRRSYMRGWAVRGQVLREMCGYNEERLEADSDVIENKYEKEIAKMIDEKSAEIDTRIGF